MMLSDELEKLTIPMNGDITSGSVAGSSPAGSVVRGGGTNIYSSVPIANVPNSANSKHVSWRPDTPPSSTPNIYTVSIYTEIQV